MTCRILSLDGGGTWGVIEAHALIEIYGAAMAGQDLLQRFDLVAGCSAGSIILAGLVENKTLGEILLLFEQEANRRAIFSPTTNPGDKALQNLTGIGPKYSAVAKLPALERLLPRNGNKPLRQVMAGIMGPAGGQVHLLIIGFDYDRNRAAFFRSAAAGGAAWGNGAPAELSLAATVHASTNAPLNYFDAPARLPGDADRYWDGAIGGHNNPALAAAIEAVTLGYRPDELRILSIGSGTVRLPLAGVGVQSSPYLAPRPASSITSDLAKLATCILDDPPDFATFAAHVLTGGGAGLPAGAQSRVVRLSPLVSPVSAGRANDGGTVWTAPQNWTVAQFEYLCGLPMDVITQADMAYIEDWCSLWIGGVALNEPIRMDGQTLEAEIGYAHFQDAVAAWRTLESESS
ncbi:MAG: patatin-like phospholipase family protein [Acetobacteraceae bacterium]